MSPPKEKIWAIDEHTKGKHLVLRAYLNAWFPILGSWNGRILFIDAFAGPGEYKDGEEGLIIGEESFIENGPLGSDFRMQNPFLCVVVFFVAKYFLLFSLWLCAFVRELFWISDRVGLIGD